MYQLFNKDTLVALFDEETYELIKLCDDKLPIGFKSFSDWIYYRQGSYFNTNADIITYALYISSFDEYIRRTFATSLNDTFWVKKDDVWADWSLVSLYKNDFDESISKYSIAPYLVVDYMKEIQEKPKEVWFHAPELTCEGSFPRCFRRENSDIFFYKDGGPDGDNAYSEMLASEIAVFIAPENHIPYSVEIFGDQIVSKCKLFTSDKVGYVPMYKLYNSFQEAEDYLIESFPINLAQIYLVDALTFNTDRHLGNYGVLVDNDTLKVIKAAPIFDLNYANLVPPNINLLSKDTQLSQTEKPRQAKSFLELGVKALQLYPALVLKLEDFKSFHFKFRGDANISEEMVIAIEDFVHEQAEQILTAYSENKIYEVKDNSHEASLKLQAFMESVFEYVMSVNDIQIVVSTDKDTGVYIKYIHDGREVTFDFQRHLVTVNSAFIGITLDSLKTLDEKFYNFILKLQEEFNKGDYKI